MHEITNDDGTSPSNKNQVRHTENNVGMRLQIFFINPINTYRNVEHAIEQQQQLWSCVVKFICKGVKEEGILGMIPLIQSRFHHLHKPGQ